jgi:hypothetical protein
MTDWDDNDRNWSPDEWNRFGVSRALRGRWHAARACFERAVVGRSDVVEFWINLSVASIHVDDQDTGRGAFEVAATLARRPRYHHSMPCLTARPFAVTMRGVVND